MGTTITAVAITMQMCLAGVLDTSNKCPGDTPPFKADIYVMHGEAFEGCTPDFNKNSWKQCVSEWKAIVEIDRDGEPLFILRPDGKIETYQGFKLDDAAKEFWEALYLVAPSLK